GAAGVGERVVLAVEGYRGFARKYLADDRDVLARAGQRLGEGLAVPAFDDLGTGDAEAEHEAAAAQVVEGQGGHGRGRRRAGRELDEVGTQLDAAGLRAPPGQRTDGVRAVGLRRPHRVVAEALGLEDRLDGAGRRPSAPVPHV